MSKIIGVIAAHPDDEILGCGATIAKHIQQGDIVHVLIMAEGATSRTLTRDRGLHQEELSHLAQAAAKAASMLGVASHELLTFPDNRMDSVDRLDVVKAIESFITRHSIAQLYTHHASDVNIDHQIIHDAVITACRPLPGACVDTILCFEIPSSTEWQTPDSKSCFVPNWFEDVSATLMLKLEALKCYEQEMRAWPHPRSYQAVEILAKWRGVIVGVDAAEAFVLSRKVNGGKQ
jgi:LmbE family N-acetylglucosaminyl deacetylase